MRSIRPALVMVCACPMCVSVYFEKVHIKQTFGLERFIRCK